MDPIEYIPQQPKPQQAPAPSFVLVNDVTGKPPPLRGPQVLKAYAQSKEDRKQIVLQFKVPYPPKANCKKCLGRGYQAIIWDKGQPVVGICHKCYPTTQ